MRVPSPLMDPPIETRPLARPEDAASLAQEAARLREVPRELRE
jgi:hypothetical protein